MPPTLKHPGVYIQEIPSGVNTIAGVSTSVTAFIGAAKRGPINRAVRVLGFADYERRFGGLDADSEMSYAVRQFFLNGGGEGWIVRIALKTEFAKFALLSASGTTVLNLTALDDGGAGNRITVEVDHQTANPASTFNPGFSIRAALIARSTTWSEAMASRKRTSFRGHFGMASSDTFKSEAKSGSRFKRHGLQKVDWE